MSAYTAASSPTSLVAGQPSPASMVLGDYQEVLLPSSSTYAWVDQMRRNEMQCNSPSSPPDTPSLYWDSQPSTAELSGPTGVHSVFEDWEDDLANVANLSAAVIVEEDGAQTLLIPADSPYFAPPTPKKPFGSKFTIDADMEFERGGMYQVPSAPHTPPNTSNTAFQADPDLVSKGLILHINTSFSGHMSGNGVTLLSSVFFTPGGRVSDEASWAPTGFKQGPDVPLDCSYTAGTASPNVEYWDDEPIWSPVVIPPFRSAPCF